MIMLLTILTLFIGGLVAWSIEAWNKDLPRWISVGTCIIASILIATLYFQPTQQELMLAGVSSTWYEVLSIPWIPRFGIGFVLAIDGLSLLMVSLTLFLVCIMEFETKNFNIASIPEGLYFMIVTMTTVGYGDYFPLGMKG